MSIIKVIQLFENASHKRKKQKLILWLCRKNILIVYVDINSNLVYLGRGKYKVKIIPGQQSCLQTTECNSNDNEGMNCWYCICIKLYEIHRKAVMRFTMRFFVWLALLRYYHLRMMESWQEMSVKAIAWDNHLCQVKWESGNYSFISPIFVVFIVAVFYFFIIIFLFFLFLIIWVCDTFYCKSQRMCRQYIQ